MPGSAFVRTDVTRPESEEGHDREPEDEQPRRRGTERAHRGGESCGSGARRRGGHPTTSYGRIISLSSCSRMWQWNTYRNRSPRRTLVPVGRSNLAMIRVTSAGIAL